MARLSHRLVGYEEALAGTMSAMWQAKYPHLTGLSVTVADGKFTVQWDDPETPEQWSEDFELVQEVKRVK